MAIAPEMLALLKTWKQASQFSGAEDWVFASPAQLGRKPWSDDQVRREFQRARQAAGIEVDPFVTFGTHSMRNTYRSWLDAAGTQIAVQQKLMRHADIRTTFNTYGDVVTDEMSEAQGKVVSFALNRAQTERSVS